MTLRHRAHGPAQTRIDANRAKDRRDARAIAERQAEPTDEEQLELARITAILRGHRRDAMERSG